VTLFNPCIRSIGPKNAKIVLLGEAPGAQEELAGVPFIGASGQHLDDMLKVAGLFRRDLYLTNVLFTRPPGNKLDAFLISKRDCPAGYPMPSLRQGKYLHPDLLPELDRLYAELTLVRPNLIIACGGPALWAITKLQGITKLRGTIQPSKWGKVLPTLHPATVLYDWANRPIIIADFMKAKIESAFPEIVRPKRQLLINPTLAEVEGHLYHCRYAKNLSLDVETKNGQITVFGIATSKEYSCVIPFYDRNKPNKSYWFPCDEIKVRQIINRILLLPVRKLFQNGLYDLQYILREGYSINLASSDDTMILHHAMYPELPKSLGFMGSIYTNESSWKLLRDREDDSNKREEI
jgi:uracil-DNA glycosylase